ncbi:MAG: sugar phosphate isomerase/epimerase [Blastocatellia bacterium]|nr:sugar phosphate isomerase/epimerase [Blastocatellia bacterium]
MMYSRREFGKITLAGLPLTVALARGYALGSGRIDSRINGVRIGIQSYSFRTLPLDEAIKAMSDIGIGECELFSGHVEPLMGPPAGAPGAAGAGRPPQVPAGGGQGEVTPEMREARREAMRKRQEELRQWRLSVSLDHFKEIRQKFDAVGIRLQAYNYSFNDNFNDEEIDRGFQMAEALGVKLITASSTLSAAKRVAPFAEKYKITVAMHGHSNLKDPNQFAKPESFSAALAMSKYFAVNLDVGHFFAAGYDPLAYIEANHDRITNLHLKDRKKNDGPNTPWGEGDTPIKQVLQLLKNKKYDIPANIEYEYNGADAVVEVGKCFKYIKDSLA